MTERSLQITTGRAGRLRRTCISPIRPGRRVRRPLRPRTGFSSSTTALRLGMSESRSLPPKACPLSGNQQLADLGEPPWAEQDYKPFRAVSLHQEKAC